MQLSESQDRTIHVLALELVFEYAGSDCGGHGVGNAVGVNREYAVSVRPELVIERIDAPHQRLLILIRCADSKKQRGTIFDGVAAEREPLC